MAAGKLICILVTMLKTTRSFLEIGGHDKVYGKVVSFSQALAGALLAHWAERLEIFANEPSPMSLIDMLATPLRGPIRLRRADAVVLGSFLSFSCCTLL